MCLAECARLRNELAELFAPMGEMLETVMADYNDDELALLAGFIERTNGALGFPPPH